MRIKQVAEQIGITEKNIRFYEQEGLLHPKRCGAYRDYGPDDLERLKQIKFLRRLGISLACIKQTLEGEITLRDCIDLRREELRQEQMNLKQIDRICRELQSAPVRLEGLAVDGYLQEMDRQESLGQRFINIAYDYLTRAKNIWPTPEFWFEPQDPILKREDFTNELMEYCRREHRTLDIVHEGLEPVAYVDGKKYLFLLEQPHMLELKGLLRVFLPFFTVNTYGFKFAYAYPYQA